MSTQTKDYSTITISQLKQLIENCDDDREIRIWVEMKKAESDPMYLEGRRLIGVMDDPNDEYVCFVAGYYRPEDLEDDSSDSW